MRSSTRQMMTALSAASVLLHVSCSPGASHGVAPAGIVLLLFPQRAASRHGHRLHVHQCVDGDMPLRRRFAGTKGISIRTACHARAFAVWHRIMRTAGIRRHRRSFCQRKSYKYHFRVIASAPMRRYAADFTCLAYRHCSMPDASLGIQTSFECKVAYSAEVLPQQLALHVRYSRPASRSLAYPSTASVSAVQPPTSRCFAAVHTIRYLLLHAMRTPIGRMRFDIRRTLFEDGFLAR